jgi:Secretion system C-terminal sorting domain
MKKSATLLLISCYSLLAFSQSPFTITASNFPVFGLQKYSGPHTFNGATLSTSANGVWDLSAYSGSGIQQTNYLIETLDVFTQAGVDVYLSDVKALTPALGYEMDSELDFNTDGVFDKGFYVGAQAYSLAAFTGNNNDSLTFPLQGALVSSARQIMQFPATHTTAWSSQSRRVVDFNLTVGAAGLNKTPCKHVFTIFRTDTIAGWGTLRVYANGAPSVPYGVLVNRSVQFAVDSFFVGGPPAPPALLNAFGITQGQKTDIINRLTAYREGHSMPLAVVFFENSNFTTPTVIYTDSENLTTTATHSPENLQYTTLLYPNPSADGVVHLQIAGDAPTIRTCEIIDLEGRVLQRSHADLQGNAIHLAVDNHIANGAYFLRVLDDKKQTVITEQFILSR